MEIPRREQLAILSLNTFVRPEGIHSGKWFSSGDFKDLRISLLLQKIQNYDIVFLQEMFEIGVRQRRFLHQAASIGFQYHCGSVWPRVFDSRLIDGGLLILSRFPIVEREQLIYTLGEGADGICAKGVLYARIQLSPDLSDCLHVFTTHTQAGDQKIPYDIRTSQLSEFAAFVRKTVATDPVVPVLISGDFNMDARHDLTHDALGKCISHACRESKIYQQVLQDLQQAVGRPLIDLMKTYRAKSNDEVHATTNGDGHATLVHRPEGQKDGKCIDYLLFSPSLDHHNDTKAPHCNLTVIHDSVRVDKCPVDELARQCKENDGQMLAEDAALLPVTHLSDHYGLAAAFELQVHGIQYPDGTPVPSHAKLVEVLQDYFPPTAFAQSKKRLWRWKIVVVLLFIAMASTCCVYVILSTLQSVL